MASTDSGVMSNSTHLNPFPAERPVAMPPQQKLTLLLLLGTQFIPAVDFSVFNVALPTIGRSVGIRAVARAMGDNRIRAADTGGSRCYSVAWPTCSGGPGCSAARCCC